MKNMRGEKKERFDQILFKKSGEILLILSKLPLPSFKSLMFLLS
jgi:hypothetical protein